jgi:hypothetical protein
LRFARPGAVSKEDVSAAFGNVPAQAQSRLRSAISPLFTLPAVRGASPRPLPSGARKFSPPSASTWRRDGARLAYGCNIGAYFSAIASASVHGWLWLVAAFVGSVLGTYLRPWFGLSVEANLARAQAGPTARD